MTDRNRTVTKEDQKRYRAAAAKLVDPIGGTVRPLVTINETRDKDGAYVEAIIWVPRKLMEQEEP